MRFKVTLSRTSFAFKEIVVDAINAADADRVARGQAGDLEYKESSAEYDVAHLAADEPSEDEILAAMPGDRALAPTAIASLLPHHYDQHQVRSVIIRMVADRKLNLTEDWKIERP